MRKTDLSGTRYGRLVAIRRLCARTWLFRCDCGTEKAITVAAVQFNGTVSCGCRQRERIQEITRHGHAKTNSATYSTWKAMKSRCLNPATIGYARYGGRGITVCERWLAFENFLADMGEKPGGHSIDRINNDGNYEPDNCRWATASQQNRNQNRRPGYRSVQFNGRTLTLTEWAKEMGMPRHVLYHRLGKNQGWSVERALTTPYVKVLNGEHNHNTKLTAAQVRDIRSMKGREIDIANAFGVDPSTISGIRARRTWRHV